MNMTFVESCQGGVDRSNLGEDKIMSRAEPGQRVTSP